MKVEIKLYKTFDPDLYALNAYGISVTRLMEKALKFYVRGERVNFHIPQSLQYSLDGKKKRVHLAFTITDPESIAFLKENIKPRMRTAFLKNLLRGCLTSPQLGVYLKNKETIKKDNQVINNIYLDDLDNLMFLKPKEKPRLNYAEQIKKDILVSSKNKDYSKDSSNSSVVEKILNTQNNNHQGKKHKKKRKKPSNFNYQQNEQNDSAQQKQLQNQFGDYNDLAPNSQKNNKKETTNQHNNQNRSNVAKASEKETLTFEKEDFETTKNKDSNKENVIKSNNTIGSTSIEEKPKEKEQSQSQSTSSENNKASANNTFSSFRNMIKLG